MEATYFSPKRKFNVLQRGREAQNWNIPKIFWRQSPHANSSTFQSIVHFWGTLAYSWNLMSKRISKKLLNKPSFYRAFSGFVYSLSMIQWKRRFDPDLAARWYNLAQSLHSLKCNNMQKSSLRQSQFTSPGSFYTSFIQHRSAFILQLVVFFFSLPLPAMTSWIAFFFCFLRKKPKQIKTKYKQKPTNCFSSN